jgi:dsDNA-specific endonuclease/ATPase MutS2
MVDVSDQYWAPCTAISEISIIEFLVVFSCWRFKRTHALVRALYNMNTKEMEYKI